MVNRPPLIGNVVADVDVIIGSMTMAQALSDVGPLTLPPGIILATFTSALAFAQLFAAAQASPHTRTVPSYNSAAEMRSPALISTTFPAMSEGGIASSTRTVADAADVHPHPTMVPLFKRASECRAPADTLIASRMSLG